MNLESLVWKPHSDAIKSYIGLRVLPLAVTIIIELSGESAVVILGI